VVPARAGLPHVRGGVSNTRCGLSGSMSSSPRAWGCFRNDRPDSVRDAVFPTCVGVFPRRPTPTASCCGLPHVRGGVSAVTVGAGEALESSPRAWGCFSRRLLPRRRPEVFPTCVGVFLKSRRAPSYQASLPHVRGGVSKPSGHALRYPSSSPRAWGCFLHPVHRSW